VTTSEPGLSSSGAQPADDDHDLVASLRGLTDEYERETARWARRVHDGPLQDLSAISLRLQLLRPSLDGEQLADADEMLAAVRHASDDLRSLQFELHPSALDENDLRAALRDLVGHHGGADANRRFVDADTGALTPTVARVLFRSAGLLLQAAADQHSSHVDVLLAPDGDALRLTVEIGASPTGAPFVLGDNQLQAVRDRVAAIRGSVDEHIDDHFTCHLRVLGPWRAARS